MIVASLLLVIAAAVTLLIGLLNRDVIEWVYASIACCLLAGLLLTVGVLRSRPSRKPVLQSGGAGQGASWAGASQWGGDAAGQPGGVLTRDEDDDAAEPAVPVSGDDEETRTDMPAPPPPDDAAWAPADAHRDTGELSDVRVVPPPPPEPASAPADEDDDVVVVPKPSARTDDAGGTAAAPASADDDAAQIEQVLTPIAGVGPAKRTALREHFGTYRKLRAATPEQLAEVPGISKTLAQRIHENLHG